MIDGGPAFPHRELNSDGQYEFSPGASLRDWFAGMAMQGLLVQFAGLAMQGLLVHDDEGVISEAARDAYRYADAMLKARETSE
jgi:hypothetical protein